MSLQPEDLIPPHVASPWRDFSSSVCFCGLPLESPIHVEFELDEDEESDDDAEVAAANHSGAMVALFPSREVAAQLAIDGGEPVDELHVTLAYLGLAEDVSEDDLLRAAKSFAETHGPISGSFRGIGVFNNNGNPVTYASFDAAGLPTFREDLVRDLNSHGITVPSDHGFTPHLTLSYSDDRDIPLPNIEEVFSEIVVAYAGQRTSFALTGGKQVAGDDTKHAYRNPVANPALPIEDTGGLPLGALPPCADCGEAATSPVHTSDLSGVPKIDVRDRPLNPPVAPLVKADDEVQTAFVSEINGHTILTTRAKVDTAGANKYMSWIKARMVGADRPNRNNAFWSSDDLEMGRPSVPYTPLNWLHESRHVIGTITDADFVTQQPAQLSDYSMLPPKDAGNHIAITANVWRWIYPDEAYVIEQASDQGMLSVSMECVSDSVMCLADGCERSVAYDNYVAKSAVCAHMKEREYPRRFVNPTFLGSAIIVPPVRPGWAEADARVLRQAASLAELSFDQVKPDMTSSEWEQHMAQIVRFAATL